MPFKKLTEDQVVEIRTLYKSGDYTYFQLADMFDVESGNISAIVRGRSWKHLPHVVEPSKPKPPKTHCKYGHEFTPENTEPRKDRKGNLGKYRRCITCHKRDAVKYRLRKKQRT